MRFTSVLAAASFALPVFAIPAHAQDRPSACSHAPAIVASVDFLLTEPASAPRFWRDRTGDDAAYLRIRYGGLSYLEGQALLTSLEKRSHPPLRFLELKLAYAKAADRASLIAALPPDPTSGSVIPALGESTWRALIVEDGGDWLFAELARWRTANAEAFDKSLISRKLPLALADLDDTMKTQLAKRAEAAGLSALALQFLERKDDLTDWLLLFDRLNAGRSADERAIQIRAALSGWSRPKPLDMAIQPEELRRIDAIQTSKLVFEPMEALIRRWPDAHILITLFNQTGHPPISTEVAAGLVAAIDAKALDPANAPDAILAAMVDGLDRSIGRETREALLRGVKIGGAGTLGEDAETYFDAALARLTLAPFVSGVAPDAPRRPSALSANLAWERWTATAIDLRANHPIGEENRLIAAELLDAAGKPAEALAMLRMAPDWQAARRRAHRLAMALDRRCGGLLSHPVAMSEPLYRFGPR